MSHARRAPCREAAIGRRWETLCQGYAVATGTRFPCRSPRKRRSMRAASRRPPRYSARARSRSRLEHHDAAPRGARRVPRRAHRLSSRRTTRATPTLAAPMRGASPTNAGKSRSRRAASNPSSLGLPPRVRRPPRNAENTPSAVLAATASTVRAMTEPRPVFAVVISAGLSAIPMVGGPLQTVFDAIEERTRHRAETTTREICESVGGADTVLSRIDKSIAAASCPGSSTASPAPAAPARHPPAPTPAGR